MTPDEQKNYENRANDLLCSFLNEKEREIFNKYGAIVVQGNETKDLYYIGLPSYSWIFTRQYDFCAFCCIGGRILSLPRADHMLALKIVIENDENKFLRIARRNYCPMRNMPCLT